MTIGIAWIRQGADSEELWLASDSRISGDGNIWDDCPKLFLLPRRDTAIGFSGVTGQAYPLLLQAANAIGSYRAAWDGSLEFFHLAGHLARVANSMMDRLVVDPAISGDEPNYREFSSTGDSLVLGGYSRARNRLVVRVLRYSRPPDAWILERIRPVPALGKTRILATFGDRRAKSRYGHVLRRLLADRGTLRHNIAFDFEPLEALAEFLKMPESISRSLPVDHRPASVGGAPQIIRILAGAQATPFAVRWERAGSQRVYLQGRLTFDYERLDVPLVTFDRNLPQIHAPGQWQATGQAISTASNDSDETTVTD